MSKTVVILQSNYIPWKGYFDLIAAADAFIFHDDAQYTKLDWRNRNRIKTRNGPEWLSVPVGTDTNRTIREVGITTADWQKNHWTRIEASYRSAPHFAEIAGRLRPLYLEEIHANLSQMNRRFIEAICEYLAIPMAFSNAWDYATGRGKSERVMDLCVQAGASRYLSGPAAKAYLDVAQFEAAGIEVAWFDYGGYPEYSQLWGAFTHEVSILDLLFNCGKLARYFMKCAP